MATTAAALPPVPSASASGALTADVRDDLAALAASLDACFTPVGATLAGLVPTIDTALGGLEILKQVLGNDGAASPAGLALARAAQALRRAPQLQAERTSRLARIEGAVAELDALSGRIGRVMTVLQFYTVNLRIAAAGADGFIEFANDMSLKLASGQSEVEALDAQIRSVNASLAGMRRIEGALRSECAKVIPIVPDKLERQVEQLARQQVTLSRISGDARSTVLRLQGQVATALGAMQIADITRQRLEHVHDGCGAVDGAIGTMGLDTVAGATRHLLDLLADQIDDAGTTFGAQSADLQRALAALTPECEQLVRQATGAEAGQGHGDILRDLGTCIADARSLAGQLDRAAGQAAETLNTVTLTIAALRKRVEAIEGLRYDVDHMAINATLRARRNQSIGRAVAVIASEIRQSSRELADLVRQVSAIGGDLDRHGASLGEGLGNAQPAIGEILDASFDSVAQALQAGDLATAELEQRARDMASSIDHARAGLAACSGFAARLCAMSGKLAELGPGAPAAPSQQDAAATRDLLAAVAQSYTMSSERLIHDRHILPDMVPIGLAAANGRPTLPMDDDSLIEDALF